MVVRQARTIADMSQDLQRLQRLLDQANTQSVSLLNESKSMKLLLTETQYKETSLRNSTNVAQDKLYHERKVTAELSKQLGHTQDQLITTISRLVALETTNTDAIKTNAELVKKVTELENQKKELLVECEKLRFYGEDDNFGDVNYRKLCQILLNKDSFLRLREFLGPDFRVLISKYEGEIERLHRKNQGLETSLEVLEMRLEAASCPSRFN